MVVRDVDFESLDKRQVLSFTAVGLNPTRDFLDSFIMEIHCQCLIYVCMGT